VLNLLPIPPLDGWRVMTLAGERWANWRIGDRWRTRLVVAGVGFLVAAGLALGVSLVRP
jgi:membrane-associated protease RseP (regulator of RpoE activity)